MLVSFLAVPDLVCVGRRARPGPGLILPGGALDPWPIGPVHLWPIDHDGPLAKRMLMAQSFSLGFWVNDGPWLRPPSSSIKAAKST